MKKINSSNLKCTISGIEYTWSGGFGRVLSSYERNVKQGDVRMIGNIIFYVYQVTNTGWKKKVWWIPQQEFDAEWMQEFKKAIFLD